jgi:hypothetical protein
MSLIRFRETFENDVDIVYLFISLSISILYVFIKDLYILSYIYIFVFFILFVVEYFMNDIKIMKLTYDIDKKFDKTKLENDLDIKIIKFYIKEYNSYKLLKEYKIYYIDKK